MSYQLDAVHTAKEGRLEVRKVLHHRPQPGATKSGDQEDSQAAAPSATPSSSKDRFGHILVKWDSSVQRLLGYSVRQEGGVDADDRREDGLMDGEEQVSSGDHSHVLGEKEEVSFHLQITPTIAWWLSNIHPDDVERIRTRLETHFDRYDNIGCAEARLCYLEYRIRGADGRYLRVGDRIATARDPQTGWPIFSESYTVKKGRRSRGIHQIPKDNQPNRDIHDEDSQDEAPSPTQLQATAADFETVAQNMHSGLFMMDANGFGKPNRPPTVQSRIVSDRPLARAYIFTTVTFMNASAEKLTGFKFEDIRNITFHEAVHSLYPDGAYYPIDQCPVYLHQVRNEAVRDGEETFVDKNGRYFDIRYSVSPLRGGYQEGAVIEFRDVSEEKQKEKQRMDVLRENERTEARLKEEATVRLRMSRFVDFVAHEVRNPLHGITASGSFLLDIVDQIETLALRKPSGDLRRSNSIDSDSSFLIDSPISSPGSPTGSETKPKKDIVELIAAARSHLRSIDECAAHQGLILNNLLDLSRLTAGKVQLANESFNPWSTVHSAVRMVRSKAAERGIAVEVASSTENIATMLAKGDETSFREIVLNLLGNATKFSHTDSKIQVRIDMQPTENPDELFVTGSVTDEGVGMTEEELAVLFQRFRQGNHRVSSVYGGSGLGLNITKELVGLMRGDITVKSERGKGSTFTFTTLLGVPEPEEIAQWEHQELAERLNRIQHGKKLQRLSNLRTGVTTIKTHDGIKPSGKPQTFRHIKHILAAEDNLINQTILAKYLSKVPKVKLVGDGKQAVEYLRSEEGRSVDAVIMDILMPLMDGLTATRLIRDDEEKGIIGTGKRERIPIIGLSGNARVEQMEEAKEAGMDDYLSKPCSKQMLDEVLRKWDDRMNGAEAEENAAEK